MRVLVTEDDEVLAMTLAAGLRREGMAVDVALDGGAALEHLAVNRYDVVVLDRDLPGVPGGQRHGQHLVVLGHQNPHRLPAASRASRHAGRLLPRIAGGR